MSPRRIGIAVLFLVVGLAGWLGLRAFRDKGEFDFERSRSVAEESEERRGPSRVEKPEFAEATETDPSAGSPAEVEDAGRKRLQIRGRLVDERGSPIAAGEVRLLATPAVERGGLGIRARILTGAEVSLKTTSCDADGRFTIADVAPDGRYRLLSRSPRHVEIETAITTPKEGDLDLGDLVHHLGGVLAGRVLHGGLPVAGARVLAERKEPGDGVVIPGLAAVLGAVPPRESRSDDEGRFEIAGLDEGLWQLRSEHDDYQPALLPDLELAKAGSLRDLTIAVEPGLKLRGRVLDAEGLPVADAEVRIADRMVFGAGDRVPIGERKARSDAEGRFEIGGLIAREYRLTAECAGYMTQSRSAKPGDDEVEVRLQKAALVWGIVSDAASGEGLPAARLEAAVGWRFGGSRESLRILKGREAAAAVGVEEAAGLYVVPDLARSGLVIDVGAPGYGRVRTTPILYGGGEQLRLDLALEREATIGGRVLDPEGEPVAGATVAADGEDRDEVAIDFGPGRTRSATEKTRARRPDPVTTDAEGRFRITGLAAGSYRLRAAAEGYSPSEANEVQLGAGEDRDLDLELSPLSGILGRAFAADGSPAAGMEISLERREEGIVVPGPFGNGHRSMTTDAEGRFAFAGIEPGPWRVRLIEPQRGGFAIVGIGGDDGIFRDVDLPPGRTIEVHLEAGLKAAIEGVVRHAGRPVAGAQVRVGPDAAFFGFGDAPTVTDEEGRFRLEGLTAGRTSISVKAKEAPLPTEVEIELRDAAVNRVEVELPGGAIEGRITGDGGSGLAAITVEASPVAEDGSITTRSSMAIAMSGEDGDMQVIEGGSGRVTTDDQGRFRLPFLRDGFYLLKVKGGGWQGQSRNRVEVKEGRVTRDVDFRLERGFSLELRVESKARRFFFLTLVNTDDGPAVHDNKAGRTGTTTFTGLRPGSYELSLRSFGPDSEQGVNETREVRITNRDETLRIDLD